MKKTLISISLIATLLCSMVGLAYADNVKDLQNRAGMDFVAGTVPAQSGAMDGMVPPVNALVLCMLEHDLEYDENSDVFLWNSLYYMISLYGQMDDRAELTDESLILPSETVADYAAALFTNYKGLPELPVQLWDFVTYDSQNDSYVLARGDAGLSETVIETVTDLNDGTSQVTGALVALEDNSVLCRFTATLTANNSMFGYSISDLNIL